ncbi:MAG: enoyl-CoA hydratase/isomerase family protein [bacterium]|nr:MAG: enoyl-CoA hydratase/isomerase family protein [bacterium]
MSHTTVTTEKGTGWTIVRLSSRRGLNKLGTELLEVLRQEVLGALARADMRCLALVGEGGSFAVGADLREILKLCPDTAREFSDLGNSIFRALERSEVFVVAGIDGFCLGGGLDLALAVDWRLGTVRSVFGHPGADLGLITGFGGTQRLSRLIGAKSALSWFLTADRMSGQEAYRCGFLQELCPTEDFQSRFSETVERFASEPLSRLVECKRLIGMAEHPGMRGG